MVTHRNLTTSESACVEFNLRSKVRQTELGKSQGLRPVFEAIANAFDAILDSGKQSGGSITIRLIRGKTDQPNLPKTGKPLRPVIGFEVEDNGIGFTTANFASFKQAYSDNKRNTGGKGCGRFLWLVAFNSAKVESHYLDQEKVLGRSFTFDIENEVVECQSASTRPHVNTGSLVRLVDMKGGYVCPLKTDTVARHIIDHCIEQMLAAEKIAIHLEDEDDGKIDLRKMFRDEYKASSEVITLQIEKHKFRVRHMLVKSSGGISSHKISLCARNRAVVDEPLSKYIGDMKEPLQKEGDSVYYFGTVSSAYLDDSVNETRNSLLLPEDRGIDPNEITKLQITEAVSKKVREYLKEELDKLRGQKQHKLHSVVSKKAPELRSVSERHPELVDKITIDSTDRDILTVVSGQNYDDRDELRKLQHELMKLAGAGDKLKSVKDSLIARYADASAAEGTIALAQFACHRRAVLDVLAEMVAAPDNVAYQKEETIHQIVFPLRTTSDAVSPAAANLWVIDDRLAFHHYLASDLRIDQMDPLYTDDPSAKGKEPDVVIFHHSFAESDQPETPGAITIIEFKRPARSQYNYECNPYDQIQDYVLKIIDGKMKKRTGAPLHVPEGTRFYGYIVADLHPTLRDILKKRGFHEGPGSESMYNYVHGIRLSVEAVSYNGLIQDAIRRNLAMFNALGISDSE